MNKSSVDDEVFYQHAKDMATIASIIIDTYPPWFDRKEQRFRHSDHP